MTIHDTRGKRWKARVFDAAEAYREGDVIILSPSHAAQSLAYVARVVKKGTNITFRVEDDGVGNAPTQYGETSPL